MRQRFDQRLNGAGHDIGQSMDSDFLSVPSPAASSDDEVSSNRVSRGIEEEHIQQGGSGLKPSEVVLA